MKTDFENNIHDIFEHHSETPSPDCWSKLSHRLDAMPHQTPPSSHSTSVINQVIKSTIGKISIGAAVVGGITTTICIATFNDKNDNLPSKNIHQEICINPTQNNTLAIPVDEIVALSNNQPIIFENSKPKNNQKDYIQNTKSVDINSNNNQTVTASIVDNSIDNPFQNQQVEQQETVMQKSSKQEINKNNKELAVAEELIEEDFIEDTTPFDQEEIRQPQFNIPNIITPNGDQSNDFFVINPVEGVTSGHLYIYSINGKVLYEKMNYTNDWNGENLPDGLYLYIYKFIYKDNEFIRKGMLTVKRK